jgi:hypothetical protein
MSTKFKPVVNESTGKTDFNFPAELVSISDKVMENSNGTKYVLGNVSFTYPNGAPAKAVTTQIFAKSLSHGITVGSILLSTLSRDDEGKMWIRTSHLPAGNNIDTDAFGSMFDEVIAPAAIEVEA